MTLVDFIVFALGFWAVFACGYMHRRSQERDEIVPPAVTVFAPILLLQRQAAQGRSDLRAIRTVRGDDLERMPEAMAEFTSAETR